MNFSQINLDYWSADYENEWIVGESNSRATDLILNHNGKILLCGPKFCGKKHLSLKVSKIYNTPVYFINLMNDRQIIEAYDLQQSNGDNVQSIWINQESISGVYSHDSYSMRIVSDDVCSRLNSMMQASIKELSEDLLFPLISYRLSSMGFVISNEIINYCIYRIPRTYQAVEECVQYIKSINKVSLRAFKDFFEYKKY